MAEEKYIPVSSIWATRAAEASRPQYGDMVDTTGFGTVEPVRPQHALPGTGAQRAREVAKPTQQK